MADELPGILALPCEEAKSRLKELLHHIQADTTFPTLTLTRREECAKLIPRSLGTPMAGALLPVLRVLSRDPSAIEALFNPTVTHHLLAIAHLTSTDSGPHNEAYEVEAVKILCNLAFQSESIRDTFAKSAFGRLCIRLQQPHHLHLMRFLVSRVPKISEGGLLDRRFLLRLFFVLTIKEPKLRDEARTQHNALPTLANILNTYTKVSVGVEEAELLEELLKSLYNVTMPMHGLKVIEENEEEVCQKLVLQSRVLLIIEVEGEPGLGWSLRSHTVNLLTVMPPALLAHLSSPLAQPGAGKTYMGRDTRAWAALLAFLNHHLGLWSDGQESSVAMTPTLVVLTTLVQAQRSARKWFRWKVLPPLGADVMRRPEEGETLRNRLTRLMTAPDGTSPHIAATFLFHLCKQNGDISFALINAGNEERSAVDRLIKYTGFGNAAGLLANNGLLGGRKVSAAESEENSPDDDSDTEEYAQAKPKVNPVTGCYEEEGRNPLEGMSEEQKEHEAMRLVNEINRLMSQGVIKPARVGPDGRPVPLDHILELTKDVRLEDEQKDDA